jgi:hypothetical protein
VSTERWLALGVFVGAVWILLRLGPAAIRSWQIYARTGKRRQEDAAGRAPLQPVGVADRAAAMAGLGYSRLGETRLLLPVGERFAWIIAAADAESYAILVESPRGPALTGIYSAWSDGTWLGTIHPRGEPFDRRGLLVQIVSTTLADAVAAHRSGMDRLKASHGSPRPIRSMADMLALDADYRTRFGGSRLRPITMRIVVPAIGVALIAALALAIVVAGR